MAFKQALLLVVSALIGLIAAEKVEDKFTTMPQNLTANLTMLTDSYSGFLNVSTGKRLHYVFVKSMNDPATDPVILWYNGGPGCSSLLGYFQENGPWVIDDGQQWTEIHENPHPWNKNASVLFLE